MAFLNRCIWTPAAGGLTDFVVNAPAQNGYTPAQCLAPPVISGASYRYFASIGSQHEEGDGVYIAGTTTLARSTIRNSSTGLKVNFSAAPAVTMGGPTAGDIRETLSQDRTYYVATTGSNSNTGLASGAEFLTIAKALDAVSKLDFNGFVITIQIADGTYSSEFIIPICVGANIGWRVDH